METKKFKALLVGEGIKEENKFMDFPLGWNEKDCCKVLRQMMEQETITYYELFTVKG